MAWIEIMPRFESLFRQHGRDSAPAFLDWTGIIVNRHRHRQVEEVFLSVPESLANDADSFADASGSDGFFVKKQFAVTWRERLRNAWEGFGWHSTAVREASMLLALRKAGIGCPESAAFGEDGRHAFVVTRAESHMMDLRAILLTLADAARDRLASSLGAEVARMHQAGFEHRDLFAKHILVAPHLDWNRFCILDWQRGRRHRLVPWRYRCRDLAMLDATLHPSLAGEAWRRGWLHSYRENTCSDRPLVSLMREVRELSVRLRMQPRVLEIGQLPLPPRDQQFVSIYDGRLLVVRSAWDRFNGRAPPWLAQMAIGPGVSELPPGYLCYSWATSGPDRHMPAMAHELFRLQRFGRKAPRLVAVGWRTRDVFVIVEQVEPTYSGCPLTELERQAPT